MKIFHFARIFTIQLKKMIAFALCYHSKWIDIGLNKKDKDQLIEVNIVQHCFGPFIAVNFTKSPKQFNRSNFLSYEYSMYKENICNFQLIRMICARIKPFWDTPRSKKKPTKNLTISFSFLFKQLEFKFECVCIVRGHQILYIALSKTVAVYSYLDNRRVCVRVCVSLAIGKICIFLSYR